MLGADVLPHANVHEHHFLNIDTAKQRRMWRECVTLASLRDDSALMQLRHLKRKKVLLLPSLRIHERCELLRRGSNARIRPLNDRKLVRATVGSSKKPIAKLRHENWCDSSANHA